MARAKSNGNKDSAATIGFEAGVSVRKDLAAEQAVPATHFAETDFSGVRPHGLRSLIFPGAGLEIAWGPAARDFGRGQGCKVRAGLAIGASPQRAVTAESTPATGKRPAARWGFGEKIGWLRCSSVGDRCGYPPSSRLAIQPFPRKQDSHGIFRPAPEYISDTFEEHRAKLIGGKGDYKGAKPPFNDSEWFRKDDDVRCFSLSASNKRAGVRCRNDGPPKGNANFAWVQHFIHHLAPGGAGTAGGMAGFVLANGSMSSNQSGEGDIRRALIEADLVDCMVALPGQLFYRFENAHAAIAA